MSDFLIGVIVGAILGMVSMTAGILLWGNILGRYRT